MGPEKLKEFIGDYKPEFGDAKKPNGFVKYEDAPLHLAKWAAIRAEGNANDALNELKEAVKTEAVKEVSVMRLARTYFKDDQAADMSMKIRPEKYDQDCVRDLTLNLIAKCGYTLPLKDSHVNALENICVNGKVNVDFDLVC